MMMKMTTTITSLKLMLKCKMKLKRVVMKTMMMMKMMMKLRYPRKQRYSKAKSFWLRRMEIYSRSTPLSKRSQPGELAC